MACEILVICPRTVSCHWNSLASRRVSVYYCSSVFPSEKILISRWITTMTSMWTTTITTTTTLLAPNAAHFANLVTRGQVSLHPFKSPPKFYLAQSPPSQLWMLRGRRRAKKSDTSCLTLFFLKNLPSLVKIFAWESERERNFQNVPSAFRLFLWKHLKLPPKKMDGKSLSGKTKIHICVWLRTLTNFFVF